MPKKIAQYAREVIHRDESMFAEVFVKAEMPHLLAWELGPEVVRSVWTRKEKKRNSKFFQEASREAFFAQNPHLNFYFS